MTLSQLTEAEKNRWLAEHCEPNFDYWVSGENGEPDRSPLGFWTWAKKPEQHTGYPEPTTGAAMRDLLQEKLLEMGLMIEISSNKLRTSLTLRMMAESIHVFGTRASVWVDAAMLAMGWEEK